jgi:hypothetical protein
MKYLLWGSGKLCRNKESYRIEVPELIRKDIEGVEKLSPSLKKH